LAEMIEASRRYSLYVERKFQLRVDTDTETRDTAWRGDMVSLQDNLDACDFLQLLTSADPHYSGLIRIKLKPIWRHPAV